MQISRAAYRKVCGSKGPSKQPSKNHLPCVALALIISTMLLTACTAVSVAGATVGAAVAVTGVAVKTTGAAVGAVIPDGDHENEKQKNTD